MKKAAFWYSVFSLAVVRVTGKELCIERDKREEKWWNIFWRKRNSFTERKYWFQIIPVRKKLLELKFRAKAEVWWDKMFTEHLCLFQSVLNEREKKITWMKEMREKNMQWHFWVTYQLGCSQISEFLSAGLHSLQWPAQAPSFTGIQLQIRCCCLTAGCPTLLLT